MVATVAATRLGQRMTFDLAADLFMHLQRVSLLFHSRRPTGDVIARVTGDTYGLQLLVTGVMPRVLQASITLVAMFAIMVQLSPSLTLLALAVVPLQVLAIAAFKGSMRERSRKRRDLEGGLLSLVQQTLTAVPVVQAFTRERIEHERFRAHADRTVVAYVRESMAGKLVPAVRRARDRRRDRRGLLRGERSWRSTAPSPSGRFSFSSCI